MTTLRCCVIAVAAASCSAFVGPAPSKTSVAVKGLLEPYGSGVDAFKEIEKTLDVVDQTKLLTKLAKSGLLSKLDKAGVQLKDVEPLLLFAEENGLVAFLGDINDEVLPQKCTYLLLACLFAMAAAAPVSEVQTLSDPEDLPVAGGTPEDHAKIPEPSGGLPAPSMGLKASGSGNSGGGSTQKSPPPPDDEKIPPTAAFSTVHGKNDDENDEDAMPSKEDQHLPVNVNGDGEGDTPPGEDHENPTSFFLGEQIKKGDSFDDSLFESNGLDLEKDETKVADSEYKLSQQDADTFKEMKIEETPDDPFAESAFSTTNGIEDHSTSYDLESGNSASDEEADPVTDAEDSAAFDQLSTDDQDGKTGDFSDMKDPFEYSQYGFEAEF